MIEKNRYPFFYLCGIYVQAQYDDTEVYHFKAALTGVYNKTNTTEFYLANNSVRFAVFKKKTILNTYGNWVYGKQKTEPTNNDFKVLTDFNSSMYNVKQIFFLWGYGAYDNNYSLKIDSRVQVGAGLGYNILKKYYLSISLSDGLI